MLEEVLARARGGPRAHALRVLGELRYHQDSPGEALELYAEALAEGVADPSIVCQIQLQMAFASLATGDFIAPQSHAHQALALANVVNDPLLVLPRIHGLRP